MARLAHIVLVVSTCMVTYGRAYKMLVGSANYGGSPTRSVHVLRLNDDGVVAEEKPELDLGPNPSWVCTDKDKTVAVATLESVDNELGGIASISLVQQRHPVPLDFEPVPGGETSGPCHCEIDPEQGLHVITANYALGTATVYPIDANGGLSPASQNINFPPGSNAHCVTFSPDNKFVYITDLGLDIIHVFTWNGRELTALTSSDFRLPEGTGPRHMVFQGSLALLVSETSNELFVLEYNSLTGRLAEKDKVSTLPAGFPGVSYVAEVKVYNSFVYVSNRGHDSIAIFKLEGTKATSVGFETRGIAMPRGMGLSPDGKVLMVGAQQENRVNAFSIDAEGKTTPFGEIQLQHPVCIEFIENVGIKGKVNHTDV